MATTEQQKTAPAGGQTGRRLAALLAALVLLLILVAALVWKGAQKEDPRMEPNATVGMMPGKTAEQIEEELNRQIGESMIAFVINGAPTFRNGEGDIWFENPSSNNKYTRVELYLDEGDPYAGTLGGDRLLYKSGLLKPGSYVESIRLKKELPAGSYSCTARIFAYKLDGETYLGEVQAGVQLTMG